MSGGHWEYSGFGIQEALQLIANDPSVQERWPLLSHVFNKLAPLLYRIEHEIDWDLSGDSKIESDGQFDLVAVGAILDILLKELPDTMFPKGKWATIQAWQGRTGSESTTARNLQEP